MGGDTFTPEITPPRPIADTDYVFLFRDRELLIHETESGYQGFRMDEIQGNARDLHFIGTLGDRPCFAGTAENNAGIPDWKTLRSVYLSCPDSLRAVLATAVQIADWDKNHHYCGKCGNATRVKTGERCRECTSCGHTAYPRISPAIIVGIIKNGTILLANNRRHADPMYSIIAGFVEPGENLENAVHREIAEETSLTVDTVRYFGSQSWPFPNALMVGFTASYVAGEITLNEELASAGWFSPADLPRIPPHGTISRKIIDWFIAKGGDVVPH